MPGERLDTLLVLRGEFESREKARAAVLAGLVLVDGIPQARPGARVREGAHLEVKRPAHPYVGRGGLKLEAALDRFGVEARDRVALDAGASTGGFTDVLLRRGARLVYAVDVGYGQLDWRLRTDPRVVVMERTNLRLLDPASLPEPPGLVTLDLSFISLGKVLGVVSRALAPGGEVLALVKPQFEAGRAKVGKGGVVRDPRVHRAVLAEVAREASLAGLGVVGVSHSPLRGPKGNLEFWLHLAGGGDGGPATTVPGDLEAAIEAAVVEAHRVLGREGGDATR